MQRNLRQYLRLLHDENEIVEIATEVDPYLELAEIQRRVIAAGGPALLFRRVKGSPYPLVTNLYGSIRRLELAFGQRPERFVRDLVGAVETLLPPAPGKLWQARDLIKTGLGIGLRNINRDKAPLLYEYVEPARLDRLPVVTTWPEDGGPFITQPLVYTEDPQTKQHNLGMYRIHIYDKETTGIHWQIAKGGGFHYHEAEEAGKPLKVTIFLGGPPALAIAAIAPLPEGVPELLFASLLLGERLGVVKSPKDGRRLIAEAEFAICGEVYPVERRMEGPFGDHFGYYSLAHEFPVFHAKGIWQRRQPIYPAFVVGKPARQEDFFIGDYLQNLLSPLFPLVMPNVRALWTYGEAGFHSLAGAVVRERYDREALGAALRILGEGQLSLTKFLVVTNGNIDLRDGRALFAHVLARFNPARDLVILGGTSMDTLDYAGPRLNQGSKAIMLGLGEPVRRSPVAWEGALPPGINSVAVFCPGALVVSGQSYPDDPQLGERLAQEESLVAWPLVVIADDTRAAHSTQNFFWTTFTRMSPESDIHARNTQRQHRLHYELPIIIDARMKPSYPVELFPDAATTALVDRRWGEYFPRRPVGGLR